MIPPEVIALSPFAAERMAEARRRRFEEHGERASTPSHYPLQGATAVTHTSSVSIRLRGLAAAVRFFRIPAVCALVVALASEVVVGKIIALAIALAAVAAGVALNARAIVLGQADAGERRPPSRMLSTGEWLTGERARVR